MTRHFGFYLLRRPTQSIQHLEQFHQQLTFQSPEVLLRSWYQHPLAQEAIYVASPALYDRFQRWLAGETLPEADKLLTTLYKYFIRMTTRCTPYGLFAGCAVGEIGPKTALELATIDSLYKHTRLDIECLIALKEWLVAQPAIRAQLTVYLNSSLYTVGDTYRYVEQQRDQQQRDYFISAVEGNAYLTLVFDRARQGAKLAELTDCLTQAGIETEEAQAYLDQLVANHLLVFDLEPTLTGPNYLDTLLDKLARLDDTQLLVQQLQMLRRILSQPDERIQMYQRVRAWLQTCGHAAPKPDIVQVDTFFVTTQNSLSERTVDHLQRLVTKLMVLNQPEVYPDLDEFKRRFYNRYEDEEVSLVLALDHELGVGYGNHSPLGVGYAPMIDDLTLPARAAANKTTTADWWKTFLLDKFAQSLRSDQPDISLTDADLAYISQHQSDDQRPADSFYLFGNLLARSAEAVDQGDFWFNLLACKGPSAINMLSRFCEGSPDLQRRVQACVAAEEQHHPDVIFAEIVHCPDSRAGNIMTRPTLHQYEIPYMGKASVAPDYQIPVQDLLVSVQQGRVVLRSQRLNKRIIPRLSNAHNYHTGLPIYHFLGDLQHQDAHLNIHWNWGLLSQQAYLPRVRYQNMIVSRATWLLRQSELSRLGVAELTDALLAKGLPPRFVIASADNELLIDINVPLSLNLLRQALRKNETVRIKEFLAHSDACLLTDQEELFTSEVVIPFCNKQVKPIPGLAIQPADMPQRRFSIGSEWLYLKVYTGEKSSDALLVQDLYPVIRQLLANHIISQFFFIRYQDPDSHLRLRFLGNPHVEFYHHVIRAVERVLHAHVQTGVVHKIQTDTYQRELERYGVTHIGLCESLFHADSLATLDFLSRAGETCDESMRFGFAACRIDQLLTNTGLDLAERRCLLEKLKEGFFAEFNGDGPLRKQLNDKYRLYRPLIQQSIELTGPLDEVNTGLRAAFPETTQRYSVLGSLIHMTVNRIFPSKQRAYELILYHCLTKYYESACAKQRLTI